LAKKFGAGEAACRTMQAGLSYRRADNPERTTMSDAQREGNGASDVLGRLADSDQGMVRVLEDLIETLIGKNLIHFTDLPEAAQTKLLERRSLRRSVNALHLFRDDDQKLI
jgi:hypothetical protein